MFSTLLLQLFDRALVRIADGYTISVPSHGSRGALNYLIAFILEPSVFASELATRHGRISTGNETSAPKPRGRLD